MWAGILAALVLLGAGGYLAAFKRDAVRGLFAHKDARAEEAYRQGREYFLLDSDDAFRNAAAAFERAHQADDKSALPLAGLADVDDDLGLVPARRRQGARSGHAVGDGGGGGQDAAARFAGAPRRGEEVRVRCAGRSIPRRPK